ncbi:MAG: hypothetical protein GX141_01690, partial [Armatimonadetes bacterium]|nr:hypothetical protein [Armatimonadota bacterium]
VIDTGSLLSRFDEADAKIIKGRAAIEKARVLADSRVAELTRQVARQKQENK